jgi:hypothetical protein
VNGKAAAFLTLANHSFTNKIQVMAKKKKSAKSTDGPPVGLWFTKIFTEGSESESRPRKRRAIERYYTGFLRGYNIGHQSNFQITEFVWSISEGAAGTKHRLDVYITPPPLPAPPGGATTDPPTPSHPPPKMT